MSLYKAFLKKQKHEGSQLSNGAFSRDGVMPTRNFKDEPEVDNGSNLLHSARFSRMPLADPAL